MIENIYFWKQLLDMIINNYNYLDLNNNMKGHGYTCKLMSTLPLSTRMISWCSQSRDIIKADLLLYPNTIVNQERAVVSGNLLIHDVT